MVWRCGSHTLLKTFYSETIMLSLSSTVHTIIKECRWYEQVKAFEKCSRRKRPTAHPAGPFSQSLHRPNLCFVLAWTFSVRATFHFQHPGKKWATVVTDYATRHAIIRAIPTSSATDVAEFHQHSIIFHYGATYLFMVSGRIFFYRVIHEILRSCSTQCKLTTSDHPQTNCL